MDVLPGPTLTIDDDSPPPFVCENQTDGSVLRVMEPPQFFAADGSSGSSSSIGTPDESGEDDEEGSEETQSKLNRGIGLDSWDSLEESLPTKKGLSGHFDGKSRSFTDLSQVRSVKELQKQENPFNKRRRLLMASRLSRRSAFYSWSNPKSMPLLPLHEEEEEEEKCRKLAASPSSLSSSSSSSLTEEKKQEDQIPLRRRQKTAPPELTRLRPAGSFRLRSFSLADLKEHDDEEEEEDA
ncbi:uncharacterized protein LOC114757486 [Neltuma alba]|uniref:uncharacterized protein LOC114757486 n=1 Tax=Neltuma alba TaxID=207710 RepID=UPI0010A31775|nr:uncharacterized protein LOC114757486 [Prosopis alba]